MEEIFSEVLIPIKKIYKQKPKKNYKENKKAPKNYIIKWQEKNPCQKDKETASPSKPNPPFFLRTA